MVTEMSAPIKLFYCYAYEDQLLRDELDSHLQLLYRSGLITSWDYKQLIPGDFPEQEIETQLNAADVILLLVSSDFIKSNRCDKEMQQAIERCQNNQACLVPILLRPVDLSYAPFAHLHMLPVNSLPITKWLNRDEAFVDVAKGIHQIVNDLLAQSTKQQQRQRANSNPEHYIFQEINEVNLNKQIVSAPPNQVYNASRQRQQWTKGGNLPEQRPPSNASKIAEDRIDIDQVKKESPTSSDEARFARQGPLHITKHFSRRMVIGGAVTVMAMGGSIVWWASGHGPQNTYVPRILKIGTLFCIYKGHFNYVRAVAWSPDGTRIASASYDHTVQVWNAANGSHLYTYKGHFNYVRTVAWSPDGKRIASGGWDNTVQVWSAADGSYLYTYKGHASDIFSVTWSPDGTRIASASYDHTVQVWNAANGSHLYTYKGHSSYIWALAWSPDSTHIASGSGDNTVQVWNVADSSHPYIYKGHSNVVYAVAWSPDSTHIASASGDDTVQVWSAVDGTHLYTYKGHSNVVYAVAWSPDGTRIASGSDDHTVQVWNAPDGSRPYTYIGHPNSVRAVAWSPDGTRIASGGWDNTVQVWAS